jgi:hypothetical protein
MLGVSPGGWMEHWVTQLRGIPKFRRALMESKVASLPRSVIADLSARTTRELINSFNKERSTSGVRVPADAVSWPARLL